MPPLGSRNRRNAVVNPDTNEDKRPSNWHEDQNERDMPPMADYPTDVVEEPDLGFIPPANPQPVYLTEPPPGDNSIRYWSPSSGTITSKRERLAGDDRRRTRMLVRNNSTDKVVYLARGADDLAINAYPLNFGQEVELLHNDNVWAFCLGADTAAVGWLIEYSLEDL